MAEVKDAEDLYTVAPEEFIGARNELVRRLRAEKQRDEAAAVAKLRKPSATAWALNQVARSQPALIEDALAAGAQLRKATDAAVGGDAAGLRKAASAERAASDSVVDAAVGVLGKQASRPQLASTLRAAVLDEAVADELRRGVLTGDHDAPGFGFGFGLGEDVEVAAAPAATKAAKRAPAATKPAAKKRAAAAAPKEDRASAKARADAERRARQEADAKAREERRRLAELRADVKRLEKRADRLARDAERAEEEARRVRAEADAAASEAEAARQALGEEG